MMKFAALALALTTYYFPVQAEEAATIVAMENIETAQPQETIPEAEIKVAVAFVNVFSTMEQDIPSGGSVAFEGVNALTDAFDISLAGSAGGLVFKQSGVYRIQFSLHGGLTPPLPAPTPDWSFALYLNGKHVPGSTCGAFTHSPDERPQFAGGEVTLLVNKGDALTLQNSSISTVTLNGPIFGSIEPLTSASMNILKIE